MTIIHLSSPRFGYDFVVIFGGHKQNKDVATKYKNLTTKGFVPKILNYEPPPE